MEVTLLKRRHLNIIKKHINSKKKIKNLTKRHDYKKLYIKLLNIEIPKKSSHTKKKTKNIFISSIKKLKKLCIFYI